MGMLGIRSIIEEPMKPGIHRATVVGASKPALISDDEFMVQRRHVHRRERKPARLFRNKCNFSIGDGSFLRIQKANFAVAAVIGYELHRNLVCTERLKQALRLGERNQLVGISLRNNHRRRRVRDQEDRRSIAIALGVFFRPLSREHAKLKIAAVGRVAQIDRAKIVHDAGNFRRLVWIKFCQAVRHDRILDAPRLNRPTRTGAQDQGRWYPHGRADSARRAARRRAAPATSFQPGLCPPGDN
jgi:hypothetical protein